MSFYSPECQEEYNFYQEPQWPPPDYYTEQPEWPPPDETQEESDNPVCFFIVPK